MRTSPGAAFLLFRIYAALTGVVISSILIYNSQSTLAYAFAVTAGMFLLSSVLGLFIERDLSGAGRFPLMVFMRWLFA